MNEIKIIGGGLTGLSLGIALRKLEVPVTLHEASQYPRHKVCGEFINGVKKSTLDYLGISPLFESALRHSKVDWFYKNKKFIEISSAGVKESHPHEVSIIKEAPNYQGHDK